MADAFSALPIRTELVGQVVYQDVITKLGDATNPTTQQAEVDTFGSQFSVLRDISGNAIGDQLLNASYWLQVVGVATGPAAPGTASAYSDLAGGIYNSTPETLTNGQQSALQLDSAGRLLVDAAVTFPYDTNWGVVGSTTLRTAAEIGNATGAADFNAGATGAQTLRVVANQGAPNTIANAWPMEITNGTNTVTVNAAGALNTTNNALGSATGGTAGTQSELSGGIYNSTPSTLTNGEQSALQLDSAGRLLVDASVIFPYDENWGTVGATTLRTAAQIGNATGAADFNYGTVGAQTLRVASEIGNATGAADFNNGATDAQTLRVAANLAVAGANVTSANPVPVTVVSSVPGLNIQEYYTSANLSAGASVTFTYTVPATHTFSLERAWSSASGKIKAVLQNNGATIMVGFNSTANPNIDMTIQAPPLIVAGNTVSVTITNTDLLAFDVYVTIEGNQPS